MGSLAMSTFLDSGFGEITELPHTGSALEHPLVYDNVARELQGLARQGRLEVVHEHRQPGALGDGLIDRFLFRRLS